LEPLANAAELDTRIPHRRGSDIQDFLSAHESDASFQYGYDILAMNILPEKALPVSNLYGPLSHALPDKLASYASESDFFRWAFEWNR
jgi:hypothetical protein